MSILFPCHSLKQEQSAPRGHPHAHIFTHILRLGLRVMFTYLHSPARVPPIRCGSVIRGRSSVPKPFRHEQDGLWEHGGADPGPAMRIRALGRAAHRRADRACTPHHQTRPRTHGAIWGHDLVQTMHARAVHTKHRARWVIWKRGALKVTSQRPLAGTHWACSGPPGLPAGAGRLASRRPHQASCEQEQQRTPTCCCPRIRADPVPPGVGPCRARCSRPPEPGGAVADLRNTAVL
jgi:hypothetical protein